MTVHLSFVAHFVHKLYQTW